MHFKLFGQPVTSTTWVSGGATSDLGSANGERRAKPPRREGRRLQPLCELDERQQREFHEALLDADSFEDLPGTWKAVVVTAERNRPNLQLISND